MNFQDYLRTEDGTKQKSPHTIEGYVRDAELFAKFYQARHGEPFTPASLYRADVQAWLDELLAENYEPTTIIRKANALLAFVRYAKHTGAIHADVDPLPRLKLPSLPQHLSPRGLTQAERNRIEAELERNYQSPISKKRNRPKTKFEHTLAARLRAIIAIMQDGGLRVSEACAISLNDLFITDTPPTMTVRAGKGNTFAKIPLSDEALIKINDWLALRPASGGELLFDVDPRSIQRELAALGAAVGIPHLTPHRFRHDFGKRLWDGKEPANRIMILMRHASINSTLKYGQPTMDDLHQTVNRAARR